MFKIKINSLLGPFEEISRKILNQKNIFSNALLDQNQITKSNQYRIQYKPSKIIHCLV